MMSIFKLINNIRINRIPENRYNEEINYNINKINNKKHNNNKIEFYDELSQPKIIIDKNKDSKYLMEYIKKTTNCKCKKNKNGIIIHDINCNGRNILYSKNEERDNCIFKPKITKYKKINYNIKENIYDREYNVLNNIKNRIYLRKRK